MNLEMQNRVASNIRHLRSIFGYTQAQVADALHICRTTYTLYESGKKMPSTDALVDLASFYHIRLDFLLDANASKYISYIVTQDRSRDELLELIKTYFKLSPSSQSKLIERATTLLERDHEYIKR